jgi:hypothetical protein
MFGDRFRIAHDEAAATWGERRDPWMMTLPCAGRGVTIYPHGGSVLAVECDGHPILARRIAAIPGVRIHQRGGNRDPDSFDGDTTFLFDVALFEEVAEVVKPRKKYKGRPMTEDEKVRMAEIGRQALARHRQKSTCEAQKKAHATAAEAQG